MDVFDKIDEFEKKISSNILKRVNYFKSIIQDIDQFISNQEEIKDYKLDKNLKEIITEVLENQRFKNMTLERSKNLKEAEKNNENKNAWKIMNMKEVKKKEKTMIYNQNSFKTIPHFNNKHNEIEIVSNVINETIKNNVRKSILNLTKKIKDTNFKRLKLSKKKRSNSSSFSFCLNENDSKSFDQSQKVNSSKNLNSTFSKLTLEKGKLTCILSPELVKKSIKQMKIDEVIIRETNVSELIKNNDFTENFKNYEFNFRNTVKEADNVIQTSVLNTGLLKTKKLSSNKQKDFIKTARCNNKFFSQKIIEVRNTVNENDNLKMINPKMIRRSSTKNKELIGNKKIILDSNKISAKQEFILKKEKEKFFIIQNRVLSSKIKIKK